MLNIRNSQDMMSVDMRVDGVDMIMSKGVDDR